MEADSASQLAEELKQLSAPERQAKLNDLKAEELRSLLPHFGHSSGQGKRAENIAKILEAIDQERVAASPTREDGRGGRSPRTGKAANAVRVSASAPVTRARAADPLQQDDPWAKDVRIFAFAGFPKNHPNQNEMFSYISEKIQGFFKDFPMTIIGTHPSQGLVGVEYNYPDSDAIHKKLHDLRDKFSFQGSALTIQDIQLDVRDQFCIPSNLSNGGTGTLKDSPTVQAFLSNTGGGDDLPRVEPMPTFASVSYEEGSKAERMAIDSSSSSDVSEAPEVTEEVTLRDVMRRLNTMEKRGKSRIQKMQSEMRSYTNRIVNETFGPLDAEVKRLTADHGLLSDRVTVVEKSMGLGVSEDSKRLFRATVTSDPAHTMIEVKGFTKEDKAMERIKKIQASLKVTIKGIEYQIGHLPAGPRGKRTIGNSYLQFSDEVSRDEALSKLTGKMTDLKNFKGETVKFGRARTKIQKTRNYHLYTAYDMIKEFIGEKDVSLNTKMPIRSVQFKGENVFEQGEFQLTGKFLGACNELTFPEDKK